MGGATLRFVTLISSPLPLLHHCRPSFLLRRFAFPRSSLFLSPLLPLPLSPSSFIPPLKCFQQLHSQPQPIWDEIPSVNSSGGFSVSTTNIHHPWSEFSDFVSWVSRSGYCNAPLDVLKFMGAQQLSEQFLKHANACLAFARDHPTLLWCLPMEEIEVVVENGSPFLFKNASAAAARMKSFLRDGSNDVLESDKPSTVDLMEFLLSYAHLAFSVREKTQIHNRLESSVRILFNELAKSKGSYVESVATVQKQFSETYVQAPRPFVKGVEMKKGDWICPSCSFMNFAKNSHCLQCEEHRPKKFVTGGEWECPQCDFFNFRRNVACLRCDCKKPEINPSGKPSSVSGLRTHTSSVKGNTVETIAGTEVEQQWFSKIRQLEKLSDMGSALADEDLPETLKAGDYRFAASARNSGVIDYPDHSSLQTAGNKNSIKMEISQCLDELIGKTHTNNKGGDFGKNSRASSLSAVSGSASSQYGQHIEQKFGLETYTPVQQPICNEKSSSQLENKDYDREAAEKSETCSKKVAELDDVKDLPSAMYDDNFPETMPMRKGEIQFVVSKKKDRSLISPMYKRQAAMKQAGNKNYVPFVPFPPGYFAKDKPQEGSESTHSSEQTDAISSESREAGERKEDLELSNNVDQNLKSFAYQSNSRVEHSKAQNRDSWRGKSLEGSAVKEPDPLDMSEEAKAERWFRRVAQIKDISELSQIPDEDFPSIMPMRKGVNRFVVSKRKTPLERRLTSSQYRRNLPAVSSDPTRKETDFN